MTLIHSPLTIRLLCCGFLVLCSALPTFCDAEDLFEPGTQPAQVLEQNAGEGPAWHRDYGLFFSGHQGITLLKPSGETELFLPDAKSNGLMVDGQGRLLICQPGYRRVSRMNLKNKQLEVLTDSFFNKSYNQPNDVAVDSKGRIYFSDPRYGDRTSMEMEDADGKKIEGVYRIDLDGKVTRIIRHQADRPNGVLVTPDDRYLFVADNNNNTVGGARILWRFELDGDGKVVSGSRKKIYDWKTGRGPDGMSLDRKGRLYVAGGRNEPTPGYETADEFKGGVYVFSPKGDFLKFVGVPRDEVTNCSFGGDDLKTLYITAGGTLWSIRTTTAGLTAWER